MDMNKQMDAFNDDIEITTVMDEYEKNRDLSDAKIFEIKNILTAVQQLTTENDDVEMTSMDNQIITVDKTYKSDVLTVSMHCSRVLQTQMKINLTNNSFIYNKNIKGKSNSFLFFDDEFKICFKEVRKNEFEKIILEVERFSDYFDVNENSLIARVLGIFTVNICENETFLLAMNNIFDQKHSEIYDLKGLDVIRNDTEGIKLKLKEKIKLDEEIILQLKRDVTFLMTLQVMDYSIIVGKTKENKNKNLSGKDEQVEKISVGIVDTFTEYGIGKKIERLYSVMFCESGGSSTNPVDYANRMMQLINEKFSAE